MSAREPLPRLRAAIRDLRADQAAAADDSLVLYDDVRAELGIARSTVDLYCRQGKLARHHSRRGVTRDSLQSFIAGTTTPTARWSGSSRLTQRLVEALTAEGLVRVGVERDDLSYVIYQVLVESPTTPQPDP